jgi:thioredoxin-dependent peroxiredoxin
VFNLNSKAPFFNLSSTDGETYSLKNSLRKYVVLYCYPKDDTPGCTIETKDFNKLLPKFKKLNCDVFGISKDDLKVTTNSRKNIRSSLILYLT